MRWERVVVELGRGYTPMRPARQQRNATIDDVALVAGVSKGTVSNVINGRVAVAPETRRKVEQAIADLAFRPAELARALTSRKRMADFDARLDATVPRLTTVGYVSVDYFACLDRLPEREERRLSREIIKSIGGPAANVAAIAANLGAALPVAASLITAIGIDQESDWAAAELADRRVDLIVPRERRAGRLNRAIVMVDADGRRTIINEPSSLAEVDVQTLHRDDRPGRHALVPASRRLSGAAPDRPDGGGAGQGLPHQHAGDRAHERMAGAACRRDVRGLRHHGSAPGNARDDPRLHGRPRGGPAAPCRTRGKGRHLARDHCDHPWSRRRSDAYA